MKICDRFRDNLQEFIRAPRNAQLFHDTVVFTFPSIDIQHILL